MRKLLISALVPMSLLASPALAAPTSQDIVSALPHPFDVEEAGDKLGAALGAIVDLPIGNVLRAIDPASGARADETIGDIAGREDPRFEERLQGDVAGLSGKAADMLRGLSAAAPALSSSLERFERDLERTLGGLAR